MTIALTKIMSRRQNRSFVSKVPRSTKRRAGRTQVSETPLRLHVRGVDVSPEFPERARALLGRRLGRFGTHIERAVVRVKNLNGKRGGVDTLCRIELTVAGRRSVFVEERALDADQALARAAASVARAMARSVERVGLRTPAPTRTPAPPAPIPRSTSSAPAAEPRRERPRRHGMVYVLETSATKPSRKSTRKSANRLKGGSKKMRRTQRKKHSPKARAARAQRQRQRSRIAR
jgi:hypothetical protein